MSASSLNQNEWQWLQLFERTLKDILEAINPLREDWNVRFLMRDEIRAVVESVESLRGATVEPYGSFVSNLFTKWGDLDISIELKNGSYISSAGRKHKQSVLAEVLQALRRRGGFRRLLFISNARVPILKLEGRYNISCDISINNLSGQMKSKMLFWINEIDGRFRDLVLLVKVWANNHRINDSKSGTLNSYCLSLLVVFHFQTLEPAILPPLREIYPGNMIDDLAGVRAAAEKHIEDICGANILRIKADRSRIINKSSLSELFISFLTKFSDICSRASTQGVSPFAGQMEDINSVMRWLPKTYALFVEDPFEQPANTARTVSSNQLIKIAEAIRVTQETLVPENRNIASLASIMIGQHQPPLFGTTKPVTRNGFNPHPARRYPPSKTQQTRPNFPRKPMDKHQNQNGESNGAMNASTSQKNPMDKHQNQNGESNGAMNASTSQKSPMDKHQNQNGESNGAMNASTSQKPQVWRPRK